MGRRALLLFWSATAVAVFLAGGVVATVPWVMAGPGAADVVVLAVSLMGLLASLLVAGRIAVVTGRLQRQQRAQAAARHARGRASRHTPPNGPADQRVRY